METLDQIRKVIEPKGGLERGQRRGIAVIAAAAVAVTALAFAASDSDPDPIPPGIPEQYLTDAK